MEANRTSCELLGRMWCRVCLLGITMISSLTTSKSSLHPPSLIKSALDGYVVKHNLVDPRDPRSLLLDDELGRACGIKKPAPGEKLAREEVMKKLKAGVAWSVSIDGVIRLVHNVSSHHHGYVYARELIREGKALPPPLP